ncbi:MAG: SDR family NAD(P)-dependent oxidoreductase, partial [Burkholderiaceae bacterium]|nr:SDR family NAD(P)-dependent oxidoreductase [Burkholderiaceae bacterium]
MEGYRPAPAALARRAGRKLGRPRLLIIGCGDVGLRIVSRLAARFRLLALT